MSRTVSRAGIALTAAALVALTATGCTASAEGGAEGDALPSAWQGSDLEAPVIIYPPYGQVGDDGEVEGLIVDLGNALADEVGIEVTQREEVWENVLTGVQSEDYVWTFGAEITNERLEVFDFTPVNESYTTFLALPDSPDVPDDVMGLCGLTVSAVAGAIQAQKIADLSPECEDAGEEPITVGEYKDLAAAYLAVESGNADVQALVYPAAADILDKEPDARKITGPDLFHSIDGIAMQKGTGAAERLTEAMNTLIETGTYQEILDRWGLGELALEQAETNPEVDH